MGADAVARMAREDTRWFAIAVVILSLVLFLALPITALIYVATEKRLTKQDVEIRKQGKELKELRREIKDGTDTKRVGNPD